MDKETKLREIESKINGLEEELDELYRLKRELDYVNPNEFIGKCYKEDFGGFEKDEEGRYYKILEINGKNSVVIYLNNFDRLPLLGIQIETFPFDFPVEEISSENFDSIYHRLSKRLENRIESFEKIDTDK